MFKLFRKKTAEDISRVNPGYEETERRTPAAGKILLVVMFVAGVFFGWRALDDLARVPREPAPLSSCSYGYRSAYVSRSLIEPAEPPVLYREYEQKPSRYYYGNDYTNCAFNDLETKHELPSLFNERKPLGAQWEGLTKEAGTVGASLQDARQSLERIAREYGLSLQELEVRVRDPLFSAAAVRQQYQELRNRERELETRKTSLESAINALNTQIKVVDDKIREAYKPVFKEQNSRLRWYDFKVFLLQLLFTMPFFWLVFRWYARLHRKNSPYTIVATGVLAVAAILLLRVILFWFWDLFLAEVLRTIWRWIQNFRILRSIVFYLGMVLSFAVFGGAVYWLQRKIFDPRRVAIRRFRAKQCPQCQTSLDLSVSYCPNCGYHLKEKCAACGALRFVDLPHCPNCGSKR